MMDDTMRYGQVECRANQIASWLIKDCGVEVEDCVGLLYPRSFEQIVALLGILKAGAAYVPLDVYYPNRRIQVILEDLQ